MRKISLLTGVSMCLIGSSAFAADIAPPPAYDWSGAYVGIVGGYAFGGDDKVGLTGIGNIGKLDVSGFAGGVTAGYNFQHDSIVLGLEGDLLGGSISDKFSNRYSGKNDIDFYGTARLRGGFAFDNALIYATGGLAFANMDYKVNGTGINDSFTRLGYAVGGGIEYAFDSQWSMKAEYLYVGLGKKKLHGDDVVTLATPSFQTVRFGLNYKF
ncbi:outer membrane protein [Aestuariivirga sp.]|uniref:outer membrane protein n=1 Tax=Aestuariivirga sp. TaxID=2650926 RepID=UPI0039E28FF7